MDISFHTGDVPPSPQQIAFFREVEARFSELWAALRVSPFKDIGDLPDGTTMAQFCDSLVVFDITFWNIVNQPYIWEFTCTTQRDDHLFTIHMSGFEDQGLSIDG